MTWNHGLYNPLDQEEGISNPLYRPTSSQPCEITMGYISSHARKNQACGNLRSQTTSAAVEKQLIQIYNHLYEKDGTMEYLWHY